ncbi:MAG: IclR family transcriptional regulator [Lentisphaeria bacterium]|nr:IclR family transcriptional regulator [Lentisphaeria bacterium]
MNDQIKSEYNVPNLERGLAIIEYVLTSSSEGVSIADVVRHFEFPNSSVFRIMNTLAKHKYLVKDEQTKRFQMSHKFFSMAYASVDKKLLLECALGEMKVLRDELKETVVISVLSEGEGLVIDQVPGLHSFRFVCDPGSKQSLHASASVKCIIANLPQNEQTRLFDQANFSKFTPHTISNIKDYKNELTKVKTLGYAFDREECLVGVICIAAPIFNQKGYPIASVTVTAPVSRIESEQLSSIGELVKKHCDLITQKINF